MIKYFNIIVKQMHKGDSSIATITALKESPDFFYFNVIQCTMYNTSSCIIYIMFAIFIIYYVRFE